MITVVAAVIESDGRLLVTRRQEGTHLAGLWEFPGGKVDAGESHAEALVREIREELGVGSTAGALVFDVRHEYHDRVVALYFYECRLDGDPVPQLGQQMRWVTRDELGELAFPPADDALITKLRSSRA